MATHAERENDKRTAKLEQIEKEVESGRLVIRKMTPAEREQNPPRESPPRRPRRGKT
jgi:hypothetical protein